MTILNVVEESRAGCSQQAARATVFKLARRKKPTDLVHAVLTVLTTDGNGPTWTYSALPFCVSHKPPSTSTGVKDVQDRSSMRDTVVSFEIQVTESKYYGDERIQSVSAGTQPRF